MPVLRDWELALDADKVLWGQGADPALVRARRPKLVAIAEAAIAEGRPFLAPVVLYRRIPVAELRHERLLLADGGVLLGPLIASHLAAASEVIVAVCTVGDEVTSAISERFQTDPVGALALEGVAGAAAEALAEAVCRRFDALALAEGLQTSIPLNPGMIGWPLEEGQAQIFSLLDATEIGVALDPGTYHHATTEIPVAGHRPGPRSEPHRPDLRFLLDARDLSLQGSLWRTKQTGRRIRLTWSRSAVALKARPGRPCWTPRGQPASRWWRCAAAKAGATPV